MNSDYNNICRELNAFYEKPLHRWKAFLRHEYFSTPLKSCFFNPWFNPSSAHAATNRIRHLASCVQALSNLDI